MNANQKCQLWHFTSLRYTTRKPCVIARCDSSRKGRRVVNNTDARVLRFKCRFLHGKFTGCNKSIGFLTLLNEGKTCSWYFTFKTRGLCRCNTQQNQCSGLKLQMVVWPVQMVKHKILSIVITGYWSNYSWKPHASWYKSSKIHYSGYLEMRIFLDTLYCNTRAVLTWTLCHFHCPKAGSLSPYVLSCFVTYDTINATKRSTSHTCPWTNVTFYKWHHHRRTCSKWGIRP